MTAFVIDNSVVMRWVFDGAAHPRAEALLNGLETAADEAFAPALWRYEAAAVLAAARNRGALPAQEIVLFLQELEALPITVDDGSCRRVFAGVYPLATTYRLTAYDAAYLELALRRGLPLATFDAELIAACAKAGVRVL